MNVNLATREVSLVQILHDPRDEIFSTSQGNTQMLPGKRKLMGYGSNPKIKEYNANGTCVMTAQFGFDGVISSYRSYRSPWVGIPKTLPDVFSCFEHGRNKTNVYMSWNGATEHKQWKVFGASRSDLKPVAVVRKTGFETVANIKGSLRYVQVEAHGLGIQKGVSKIIPVKSGC
jgi:hypothetical protein